MWRRGLLLINSCAPVIGAPLWRMTVLHDTCEVGSHHFRGTQQSSTISGPHPIRYYSIHPDVMTSKLFPHCVCVCVWGGGGGGGGIRRRPLDSPHKGPPMQRLVASLDYLLSKQSNDRWFETSWRSWDVTAMYTGPSFHLHQSKVVASGRRRRVKFVFSHL